MLDRRSALRRATLPFLTVPLSIGLLFLPGCGDEPTKPAPGELPAISGAVVPETAEEGESIEIHRQARVLSGASTPPLDLRSARRSAWSGWTDDYTNLLALFRWRQVRPALTSSMPAA